MVKEPKGIRPWKKNEQSKETADCASRKAVLSHGEPASPSAVITGMHHHDFSLEFPSAECLKGIIYYKV